MTAIRLGVKGLLKDNLENEQLPPTTYNQSFLHSQNRGTDVVLACIGKEICY